MELATLLFAMLVALASVSDGQTVMNGFQKPDNISNEMYCLGCQVTVKELDFMLRRKPLRGMGETVTRALMRVCDENNFKKYDVDYKTVLKVCKHMKGNEDMESTLINEYGRKHEQGKQFTYLEMTDMICGTVLRACNPPSFLESGEDGGISYNAETEEFVVKAGRKVRVAGSGQMKTLSEQKASQDSGSQTGQTPPQEEDTLANNDQSDAPEDDPESLEVELDSSAEGLEIPTQEPDTVITDSEHANHEEL